MRQSRYRSQVLVLSAVVVAAASCEQTIPPVRDVDEEPLLLLEDGDGAEDLPPPAGPVADNGRCHVCHINYEDEKLAVMHARANVGCERCHGSSDAHCGDEDHLTPPDVIYAKAKINPSCMTCHPRAKIDIKPHRPVLHATGTPKKHCTDCHGKHRLSRRLRRWDKTTRKLIEDS